MFSILHKREIIGSATMNLLSANALNLVKAKILSIGTRLTLYQTILTFNNPKGQDFKKHCEKRKQEGQDSPGSLT